MSAAPATFAIALEQPGTPGKFWRVEVRGRQHLITFGARGAAGQTRLTQLDSAEAARADAEKRAAAKRKDGYR